jgi:hypothetical protein
VQGSSAPLVTCGLQAGRGPAQATAPPPLRTNSSPHLPPPALGRQEGQAVFTVLKPMRAVDDINIQRNTRLFIQLCAHLPLGSARQVGDACSARGLLGTAKRRSLLAISSPVVCCHARIYACQYACNTGSPCGDWEVAPFRPRCSNKLQGIIHAPYIVLDICRRMRRSRPNTQQFSNPPSIESGPDHSGPQASTCRRTEHRQPVLIAHSGAGGYGLMPAS